MLVAASGAAIAVFAVAAPAALAGASGSAGATPACAGITVIVDFSHFDRAIERGCAPGRAGTALAALRAAGFETAGTASYGDAFVCRIDGVPAPKTEACVNTPPGNASWSFYFAQPTDAAWTYSTAGVTSMHPAAGTILAFAFGNYAKPTVLPSGSLPSSTTTTATPSTTVPARTPPPTGPRVTAEVVPPITVIATAPASTAPAAPNTAAPATTTTTPISTTNRTSSSAQVRFIDRGAARSTRSDSSGSPFPAFLTVVVVAVLGAGALLTGRNRRRGST